MDDEEREQLPLMDLAKDVAPCRGANGGRILLACDDLVFDVSAGRAFYGPEGKYHLFAGKDVTRALAVNSLDPKDVDPALSGRGREGLSMSEDLKLDDWLQTLEGKYELIGRLPRRTKSTSKL